MYSFVTVLDPNIAFGRNWLVQIELNENLSQAVWEGQSSREGRDKIGYILVDDLGTLCSLSTARSAKHEDDGGFVQLGRGGALRSSIGRYHLHSLFGSHRRFGSGCRCRC